MIDVSGIPSFSDLGSDENTFLTYALGANAHITGLAFDVNLTAYTPSYLSEIGVAFANTTDYQLFFMPGIANTNPGTASYSGAYDLVALGLDFSLNADGLLGTEFYEGFDDLSVSPDGTWNSGTLTITYDTVAAPVPEPTSYALMLAGLGVVGWAAKRRRAR